MASIIQQLKGSAAEVATKTYAVGVLVWNETAKRWHGGDGVTAGGIAMARYDERNDGSLGYQQRVETAASNEVTVADIGKAIVGNRATTIAFNLDPAASLTSKFAALFKNIGAGAMTIVPNGTELIDGANAPVTVPTGSSVVIKGDGTSFRTFLSNGDVTGAAINDAPALTGANLADNDKLGVYDASASVLAGITVAQFVAGLFSRAGAAISSLTGKTTPVDADLLLLGDSAAAFASKKVTFADLKAGARNKVAIIGDSKSQGASAQTYVTANTWVTRNLNTEFSDPDAIVSIASNQFTLADGADYLVAYSASYRLDSAVVSHRIYDVTTGSVVAGSYAITSYHAQPGVQVWGHSAGRAILSGGRTYRVEVYCGNNSMVLGAAMNVSGVPEVYLTIEIERLS